MIVSLSLEADPRLLGPAFRALTGRLGEQQRSTKPTENNTPHDLALYERFFAGKSQ